MADDPYNFEPIAKILKPYEQVMLSKNMTNISAMIPKGSAKVADNWLIAASRQESEGQKDPSKATSPGGMHVGVLGIGMRVVDDVNERFDTDYVGKDRLDPKKSAEMFRLYSARYNKIDDPIDKVIRIWKEGPSGWDRDTTKERGLTHYRKVVERLNKMRVNILNYEGEK